MRASSISCISMLLASSSAFGPNFFSLAHSLQARASPLPCCLNSSQRVLRSSNSCRTSSISVLKQRCGTSEYDAGFPAPVFLSLAIDYAFPGQLCPASSWHSWLIPCFHLSMRPVRICSIFNCLQFSLKLLISSLRIAQISQSIFILLQSGFLLFTFLLKGFKFLNYFAFAVFQVFNWFNRAFSASW